VAAPLLPSPIEFIGIAVARDPQPATAARGAAYRKTIVTSQRQINYRKQDTFLRRFSGYTLHKGCSTVWIME
jgi:hypothetical protein